HIRRAPEWDAVEDGRTGEARRGVKGLEVIHLERDAVDRVGFEAVLPHEIAHEPDYRLIETRRGVYLEFDVQRFPTRAETGYDVFKAGLERAGKRVAQVALIVAGERVVEAAVAFE